MKLELELVRIGRNYDGRIALDFLPHRPPTEKVSRREKIREVMNSIQMPSDMPQDIQKMFKEQTSSLIEHLIAMDEAEMAEHPHIMFSEPPGTSDRITLTMRQYLELGPPKIGDLIIITVEVGERQ